MSSRAVLTFTEQDLGGRVEFATVRERRELRLVELLQESISRYTALAGDLWACTFENFHAQRDDRLVNVHKAVIRFVQEEVPSGPPRLRRELSRAVLFRVFNVRYTAKAHPLVASNAQPQEVPEPVARFELGNRRQTLGLHELHLLKHKYGLSMQAWIFRAKNLRILSKSAATRLFREFRQRGWHREEPGDQIPSEEPERMKRLVLRAMAEDLISQSRVAELLGMPLMQFYQEEAEQHGGFPATVHR